MYLQQILQVQSCYIFDLIFHVFRFLLIVLILLLGQTRLHRCAISSRPLLQSYAIRLKLQQTGCDLSLQFVEQRTDVSVHNIFGNVNMSWKCHDDQSQNLSRDTRFPTMWYVQPAKPLISLRIRAV